MVFDYNVFCENLKFLREMAGLNKYQMSIQVDISYQYYCNIENGNRPPNFKTVIAIANVLKVDISQLIVQHNLDDKNVQILSIMSKLRSISHDRTLLTKLYGVLLAIKTQMG